LTLPPNKVNFQKKENNMKDSFIWSSDFETGINTVDDQHHHLIDLINSFSNLFIKQDVTKEDVATLITELLDYTHYHFDEEEDLMHEKGLHADFIQNHKEFHNSFIKQLGYMKEHMLLGSAQEWRILLDFLYQWLGHHILGLDQIMARQIVLIEQGLSAEQAMKEENSKSEHDVVEPLLMALSSMVELLSEQNTQMSDLNLHLEEKVAERTQQLYVVKPSWTKLALI
jgi:hemerythrin-like metal-binding protein